MHNKIIKIYRLNNLYFENNSAIIQYHYHIFLNTNKSYLKELNHQLFHTMRQYNFFKKTFGHLNYDLLFFLAYRLQTNHIYIITVCYPTIIIFYKIPSSFLKNGLKHQNLFFQFINYLC
jgi:hypothetical protein